MGKFTADKIICIARNPIDVFPSQASLYFTLSNSVEPVRPWNEYRVWPNFVKYFVKIFGDYFERVRQQSQNTPTFFLTYEELVNNQE